MLFSYNWLKEYIKGKTPKPDKLAELLTMHSFEVEKVKKIGKDIVLDIDILPNRAPDCFSHLGVAREIAVLTNSRFQIPDFKLKEDKRLKSEDFISIEIKNKMVCPRYTARVITEVKVASSPKWIKEKLKVCGLQSINNIVDITNYVMLETGQPLHAFDGDKIEGKKIIVRFAKKGERIVTLDEKKYDLDKDILVIADTKKPIAIAGIKGGKGPGIDKKTKIVVLESANFNPQVIRKGSGKLNLRTDASSRFEHGIDPNLTEFAINRAAFLIQKITGGKVAKGLIDFYPQKVFPRTIQLDLDYVERLLGVKISEKEIKDIFKKLNFLIKSKQKRNLLVKVPTWRRDISLSEDLIEEIGRIYGYDKIKPVFPQLALVPPKRNFDIFWENQAKDILKEVGFTEVYNYSFISEKDAEIFGYKIKELIEVENPVSIEQKYLRPSLIPNLLKNIQKNQKYFTFFSNALTKTGEIRIFELGKIFNPPNQEKKALSGVISGGDFYQLKGVIDLLLKKLGINNIWYDSFEPTPQKSKIVIWHPKKCAEIKVDHQEIGFLGEIKSEILEKLKIENKAVVFDLDFEKLKKLAIEEKEYIPPSPYPAAIRDLAILVPRETKMAEVLSIIQAAGGELVRDVDLFDIYEGEELPEGKKNLAFHIVYQAEDRTLKSKEIEEIQNKIIAALEKNPEWEVRR